MLLEKILFLLAPDQKAFEVLPHYVKSALEQSLAEAEIGDVLTANEAEAEYLKWLKENE